MAAVLDVRPGAGIGPISIGMTRDETRTSAAAMGLSIADFRRGSTSDGPADLRFGDQLFAYFESGDRVVAVEVGVRGPLAVICLDLDLGASYADVMRAMKVHGNVDETDPEFPSTSVFFELGLTLWADVKPVDMSEFPVQAILVRRSQPYPLD